MHLRSGFDEGARFECSDGERRMAVANALPSARFEVRERSPMEVTDNGLGTSCGCYFRVADKPLGIDVTSSWRLCLPAV